jgi:hypothetical protein
MLPLARFAGSGTEPVRMARVEPSARAEDETYSPSSQDSELQSGGQDPGNQAQEYELREDAQDLDGETLDGQTSEGGIGSTDPVAGVVPQFDLPGDSPAQVSFFV